MDAVAESCSSEKRRKRPVVLWEFIVDFIKVTSIVWLFLWI